MNDCFRIGGITIIGSGQLQTDLIRLIRTGLVFSKNQVGVEAGGTGECGQRSLSGYGP